VPRRVWLRPPAFLFITGAAGAVTLFALMLAGVLGAGWWWLQRHPTRPAFQTLDDFLRSLTVVALYFFCYGLTGVLVRRYVLSNQIKSSFTWLVALLLLGVGSAVPSTVAYIALYDEMRFRSDPGWWGLSNPFSSVAEVYEHGRTGSDYQSQLFV